MTLSLIIKNMIPSNKQGVDELVLDSLDTMYEDLEIDETYTTDQVKNNLDLYLKSSYSLKQYVDACKFVLLTTKYNNNTQAWKEVFPERAERLQDKYGDNYKGFNQACAVASAGYRRTSLVVELTERALMSMHIQYGGFRHEAILKNVELMNGRASASRIPRTEKNKETGKKELVLDDEGNPIYDEIHMVVTPQIQQMAAKTVLEYTAIPVAQKHIIEEGISDDKLLLARETNKSLDKLAETMRDALVRGESLDKVQQIGHILHDTEVEEDD